MVNIESIGYSRPRLGRPFSKAPTDISKILLIVRLRDEENMRFRVIGETLKDLGYKHMTTQGASQLYQKWREWAIDYLKKE